MTGQRAQGEDPRWDLVLRIAASSQLQHAPQLRDFLLHVCQRALEGREAEISEQAVGEMLRPGREFDPNSDNIVRVQARHLRKKLEDYFACEGKNEPHIIRIPKGGYCPRFEPRSLSEQPADPEASSRPFPARKTLVYLLGATCVVLAALCARLWTETRLLMPASAAYVSDAAPARPLWDRLFVRGENTYIVLPDSSAGELLYLVKSSMTLAEYGDRTYPKNILRGMENRELASLLEYLATRQFTVLGAATLAAWFQQMGTRLGANTSIRYARNLNIRDFKKDNFILLGSKRSIPFTELFESQLNFVLEAKEKEDRFWVRNRQPLPNEPEEYYPLPQSNSRQETYATITLVPNLSGTGDVLMLAGLSSEATEAAGDLVTSRDFGTVLAKVLSHRSGTRLPYFQVVVRVRALAGSPTESEFVAYRILPFRAASAR